MVSVFQSFLWLKSVTCNLHPFDSAHLSVLLLIQIFFFTSLTLLKRVVESNCILSFDCRQSLLHSPDHPQKLQQQMKSTSGLKSHIICKSVGKQIIFWTFSCKQTNSLLSKCSIMSWKEVFGFEGSILNLLLTKKWSLCFWRCMHYLESKTLNFLGFILCYRPEVCSVTGGVQFTFEWAEW